MSDRSVLVRLLANVTDFKAQMDQAKQSVKGVGDESQKSSQQATTSLGRMARSAQDNREAWDKAGTALVGFGAVATVAVGASIKAAMDWESAWAGVTKTVSGTPEQLAEVEKGLRGLARELPSTHDEIAAVAEAAGQLGVKTDSVVAFTRTMVDLGQTTNLSADEAATSLAQLMNVMGTAPKDVGRLGAALVALGNDGASTEADIVRLASYITGSAKLIGASESDVLALANAMTSMGINAERGGGVMTRVMQDVYAAVQSGGEKLEGFAKVAGMSGAEFARAFKADPIRAIDSFVQGLNDVEKSGGNVIDTLSGLGYIGTQDTAVLLQLKGAGNLLTDSLDLGNKAWEENTALVEEAAKRYDTTAAKVAIARNNVHDAAIEVGDVFLPVLADLAGGLADVAGWFADLPDPIKATAGGLVGVAGVGALAAGTFLLLFPRVIETYKAFQTLKTASPGVASGLGKVGAALGWAGLVVAATVALHNFVKSLEPAPPTMEATTKALLGMSHGFGELDAQFRDMSSFLIGDIDGIDGAIQRLTKPSNREKVSDLLGNLFGQEGNDTRDALVKQFNQMGESLAFMVESGNAELAAKQFELLAARWKQGGGNVDDLMALLPGYRDALDGVANEQKAAADSADLQAQSAAQLAKNLEASYGSIEGYAAALGLGEEATKELIARSSELGQSLADFVDPLGTYTGLLEDKQAAEEESARKAAETAGAGADSWRDFVGDVKVSFSEYMTALEEQVTAQQNWQLNMLQLAGRVSQGTLEELARMGPEGAPLVADLVTRSDAELDRFDELTALRSKEATDAWGAQLTMAAPVLAAVGAKAGQGVVDELAAKLRAGTITVAEIAAQYGVGLAGGINPLLVALGKRPIAGQNGRLGGLLEADGGLVDYYAGGGLREDHVAQIAPAGAWRVWAEPETGGEAYIPLSPGKRDRSVDIWRQVGDRLGVQFAEFATGGFYTPGQVPRPPSTAPFGPPLSTAGDAAMDSLYRATTDWIRENGPPGKALAWAKSQVGKPYIWGGVGPVGYDCSGFMSAVTNVLLGRSPHSRVGATATFPWPGFVPGPGLFRIGSTPDAGGGIGHMAGTLMGVNVESRGGDGVVVGTAARGASSPIFSTRAHLALAKGGILNPHVRDAGGPLLPGYTFNGTGGRETVVPDHVVDAAGVTVQSIDYGRLAAAVRQAAPRPVTVHTADNPRAIVRAIRADEQQQAALAPAW